MLLRYFPDARKRVAICQKIYMISEYFKRETKLLGSLRCHVARYRILFLRIKEPYLKRIIGHFDTTLEILKLFFSLDTWTLVLICPIAYFKRHWAWNFWTNFCIGHLDTQFEIVRVSFLLRTLGHWPWNFQALSFFGHLDTWTLGLKFLGFFFFGHLDTWTLSLKF